MRKKNLTKTNSSGFTLIELLVTLSIFAITTGIVMTSQGKFDNSVLLTNTAYDIALTLRQAQTYGVNVKESETVSGNFKYSYGLYFDKNANNKRFIMFFDNDNDYKISDTGITCPQGDLECVASYKIKRGHYIENICAWKEGEIECETQDSLNITFKRPNPEANILAGTDTYSAGNLKKSAEITISSADGSATRTIVVTKVGQIYVKR
jgi:prepilin-type N-terminal cleavage/methylation domain-containing protein